MRIFFNLVNPTKLSTFTNKKLTYQIDANDGGPGTWRNINRSANVNYQFQHKVTGSPPNTEYKVGDVLFDDYDPQRNVLIDAKKDGQILNFFNL